MKKIRTLLICSFVLLALAFTGLAFFRFGSIVPTEPLPPARPYAETPASGEGAVTITGPDTGTSVAPDPGKNIPEEINLKVPFTSQAPHQNWDLPYKEFCEEASVLMAGSFITGKPILGPDDADAKLLKIQEFEEREFGYSRDTTAEETAQILSKFYDIQKVAVVLDPSARDIKGALAQGKIVIVPLAGQQLGNPYYRQPGPLYHVLVIKGYKKNGDFITNDPGTKRGADYIYTESVIMNAIHDWNGGNVEAGKKVMIVVG